MEDRLITLAIGLFGLWILVFAVGVGVGAYRRAKAGAAEWEEKRKMVRERGKED